MNVPPVDQKKKATSSANASEAASVVSTTSPPRTIVSEANNHTNKVNDNDNQHVSTPRVEVGVNPPVERLLNQDSKEEDVNSEEDDLFLTAGANELISSSKCPSRVDSTVGSGTSSPKVVSGMSTPTNFPVGMIHQQGSNTPPNDTYSLQLLSSELEKRLTDDGIGFGVRHDEHAPMDQNGSTNGVPTQSRQTIGPNTAMRLARAIHKGSLSNSTKNLSSLSNQSSSTPTQTPPVASTRVSSRTVSRQASNPSSRVHSRAASPSSRDGTNEEDFLSSAASFMQVNRQNSVISRLSSGYPSRLTSPDMSMHNNMNIKASGGGGGGNGGMVSAILSMDGSTSLPRRPGGSVDGLANWQNHAETNTIAMTKPIPPLTSVFPDMSSNVSALSSRIGIRFTRIRSLTRHKTTQHNTTQSIDTPSYSLYHTTI